MVALSYSVFLGIGTRSDKLILNLGLSQENQISYMVVGGEFRCWYHQRILVDQSASQFLGNVHDQSEDDHTWITGTKNKMCHTKFITFLGLLISESMQPQTQPSDLKICYCND